MGRRADRAPSAAKMRAMSDLEPLLASVRAQDALFERVEITWWGAVVSDARFPRIQEPNYARVETHQPVGLPEIEEALLPAMRESGSPRSHVVVFYPEDQTDLVAAASTRGDRISWDLVMVTSGHDDVAPEHVEEVSELDERFWAVHRDSVRLFDVSEEDTLDQLQAMEREVLIPAGRRWFAVVDEDRRVAVASLLVLERTALVDHVATFPAARRRGHAEALTRRLVWEAKASGAERTYLVADPEGDAVRIYERVGFEGTGHLASWLSPLER
jgi:ribosomal protein S18 acetylase RimI-like enzyme